MEVLDTLTLSDSQMTQITNIFEREVRRGLSSDERVRKLTSLQCENTYVRALLNGKGTQQRWQKITQLPLFVTTHFCHDSS